MNSEDDEFARIEREAKLRQVPLPAKIYDYEEAYFALQAKRALAVPDAIHHTDNNETLEYIQGWNDCRQAMLAEQPAPEQEPLATLFGSLPVYDTSPQAQPAQRKPLTEEEIWTAIRPLTKSDEVCTALVEVSMAEYRAIEAAHGIKENT